MQMLTTRETKFKIKDKTITPLQLAQFEQFKNIGTEGRKGFKEWLDGLAPHNNLPYEDMNPDMGTFRKRCYEYQKKHVSKEGNPEFIENDNTIIAIFSNGAEAMWSKAGYLAYRNDMRI